ncbi:hypothetical protein HAX54_022389 [Datura stramonium]|uniref:Uncharacterized protein n=1 Tax=Datura stramonium TaxID=4076 RepID=A0ABS8UUF4_DATST|nr:hypothetical protein [Datura stramonium]
MEGEYNNKELIQDSEKVHDKQDQRSTASSREVDNVYRENEIDEVPKEEQQLKLMWIEGGNVNSYQKARSDPNEGKPHKIMWGDRMDDEEEESMEEGEFITE